MTFFVRTTKATGRLSSRVLLLSAAVSVAACSSVPTAPSPTSNSYVVAAIPQEGNPPPPSDPLPSPRGIGITRFVAFGDSITSGVLSGFDPSFLYDDLPGSYPSRLLAVLRRTYPAQAGFITVVNEGIPGERAADGRRRIQTVLARHTPGAVLLLEGINDMSNGASPSQAASSVLDIVRITQQFGVPVLLGLMPQTYATVYPNGETRDHAAANIRPFNDLLRAAVTGVPNVHIVDLYSAFGTNRALMGNDGLHPSPEGYEVMAATFMRAIERAFPVRGSVQ